MKAIHAELRRVQKQRDRLKLQLSEASEKQGLILDDDTHADLKKIMLKEGSKRGITPTKFFSTPLLGTTTPISLRERCQGYEVAPLND